jgi:hypothetical protein
MLKIIHFCNSLSVKLILIPLFFLIFGFSYLLFRLGELIASKERSSNWERPKESPDKKYFLSTY